MKKTIFSALVLLLTLPLIAQEKITLTTPETKPSNNEYRIEQFNILSDNPSTALVDEGTLFIRLVGQNGEYANCMYNSSTSPTGTFLNNALNKANLSSVYNNNATTGSLKQRVYHRLVIMGESTLICGKTLTGTLAGSVP